VEDASGGELHCTLGIADQVGGVGDEVIEMLGDELRELATGGWDVGCGVDHDSTRGWLGAAAAASIHTADTRVKVAAAEFTEYRSAETTTGHP
jgi:hypothetical protein